MADAIVRGLFKPAWDINPLWIKKIKGNSTWRTNTLRKRETEELWEAVRLFSGTYDIGMEREGQGVLIGGLEGNERHPRAVVIEPKEGSRIWMVYGQAGWASTHFSAGANWYSAPKGKNAKFDRFGVYLEPLSCRKKE